MLGDGHSWSEVAQTEDIMISLSNYTGVVRMPLDTDDSGAVHVTVKAGTPLNEISEFLDGKGLAMINLGSVAGQSIAGAISTGKTVTWVHSTHMLQEICSKGVRLISDASPSVGDIFLPITFPMHELMTNTSTKDTQVIPIQGVAALRVFNLNYLFLTSSYRDPWNRAHCWQFGISCGRTAVCIRR